MKIAMLFLLASIPVPQVHSSPTAPHPQPQPRFAKQANPAHHRGGKWYLARTGHAVYCYGPVMTLPNRQGEIERVATFCGEQLLVPLKD
jgi:hypothetical protein